MRASLRASYGFEASRNLSSEKSGGGIIMISGILLAAGESTRMLPGFKPLLKWGKRTVIGECVHQMRLSQVADIFVVLGHREAEIRPVLAGSTVQFAINEDYKKGMLSSVKTGLGMLGPNSDAVLLALV